MQNEILDGIVETANIAQRQMSQIETIANEAHIKAQEIETKAQEIERIIKNIKSKEKAIEEKELRNKLKRLSRTGHE